MSFNYITKDGVTFILSCAVTMSLANFDYHILSNLSPIPTSNLLLLWSIWIILSSMCAWSCEDDLQPYLTLVLLFVFVLGRNNNVKFSWCKIWKDFYLKGDMWNFLNIYLEVFSFFSFSWIPRLEKRGFLHLLLMSVGGK